MLRKHARMILAGMLLLASYFPLTVQSRENDAREWNQWLYQQVLKHPDIVAEREKMHSAFYDAGALEKPLYNPELETEVEREGDDRNITLGVSQTVDWWGKQEARRQQAGFTRDAAEITYRTLIQEKMAEALTALSNEAIANKRQAIAREQEAQLDAFLKLVEQRQKSGDLGEIDAELTYVSMSQRLQESAEADAQRAQATAAMKSALLGGASAMAIPDEFWSQARDDDHQRLAEQHPKVQQARAEWKSLEAQAAVVKRDTKADPSIGINGGKAGDDNTIGLTLSIPLYIRNNYRAEAQSARQQALAAESQYLSLRQKQVALLDASRATLNAYEARYARWHTLMHTRIANSAALLDRQWRAGDLSTPEYLLVLKERSESLQAGLTLEAEWHNAVIDWLVQSGQLINSVQPK